MIKITTELGLSHVLTPTVFPDGTSQVWKLPDAMLESRELEITWNFESEREIIDLLSIRKLLSRATFDLHIPFMPYARQDKEVSNKSTFNLAVLADLVNSLGCREVTSVDVHNPVRTAELFHNFRNIEVTEIHKLLIKEKAINFVVFPDKGACARYGGKLDIPTIVCDKLRDQLTGNIVGHQIVSADQPAEYKNFYNLLIIDDLCDGGATFISVAKMLRQNSMSTGNVDLYVTHGVFSKGRGHLLDNGISSIYTTNSLLRNGDGFQV